MGSLAHFNSNICDFNHANGVVLTTWYRGSSQNKLDNHDNGKTKTYKLIPSQTQFIAVGI